MLPARTCSSAALGLTQPAQSAQPRRGPDAGAGQRASSCRRSARIGRRRRRHDPVRAARARGHPVRRRLRARRCGPASQALANFILRRYFEGFDPRAALRGVGRGRLRHALVSGMLGQNVDDGRGQRHGGARAAARENACAPTTATSRAAAASPLFLDKTTTTYSMASSERAGSDPVSAMLVPGTAARRAPSTPAIHNFQDFDGDDQPWYFGALLLLTER